MPGGTSGSSPLMGVMLCVVPIVLSHSGKLGTRFGSLKFQCWVPHSMVANISEGSQRVLMPKAIRLLTHRSLLVNGYAMILAHPLINLCGCRTTSSFSLAQLDFSLAALAWSATLAVSSALFLALFWYLLCLPLLLHLSVLSLTLLSQHALLSPCMWLSAWTRILLLPLLLALALLLLLAWLLLSPLGWAGS